jgi:PHD/YefM family antitoxin component YafN of YafNO toxin-antitoxin module
VGRRYVVDENSKPVAVLLDIQEYERMVGELEEFEDILARRAYDEAKAELERGEDELIPWEQAKREIEEERKRLKKEENVGTRR